MRKTWLTLAIIQVFTLTGWAFTFTQGEDISVYISKKENQLVYTALELLASDYEGVFGGKLQNSKTKGNLYVGTIGLGSKAESLISAKEVRELSKHREGFLISVKGKKLIILGSDKRGTAYGILEISRMIGVSPWVWWADSPIEKKENVVLPEGYKSLQYPSVARRGIFINDEDWGLTPWSYLTYEPSEIKGQIGPKTHARIFELLLRLRANTFWPAMHDCTVAFYQTPGNREVADKYGIVVGTSHCEPMVRNTNAEWKQAGTGEYNYLTNRNNVLKFWEERVSELAGSDNIYTLGIRGVHDSKMLGANTLQEQKDALDQIIKDQRDMISRIVNPDVEKVPQVFIPYKEVLDVYNMGLQVPDDVTLMWTDDNYGYIRHFPSSTERARKGGNGIYNHISYWGRPHDYLWLSTTHPALVYYQMKMAFDKGAREQWIINVGDIKPAEYLIELVMDMAWNIDSIEGNRQGLDLHLRRWLAREFGESDADELLHVMNEYYRLAYIRKPEFMGNTRTEEQDPKYKAVSDMPWSENDIRARIAEYEAISEKVKNLASKVPAEKRYSWYQLIEYPVRGATEMNRKHLYGQLARHGKADWQLSDAAYDTIVALTERYNSLNNGKWNHIMDFKPRRLAVFDRAPRAVSEPVVMNESLPVAQFNGNEYLRFYGEKPVELGLGYQGRAISLEKNSSITFVVSSLSTDSLTIEVTLLPNHPVEGEYLRYAISVNGEVPQIVEYRTEGRSEEWKQNVLRNQAIRKTKHEISSKGNSRFTLIAIDEGVVIDQIKIFAN